MALRRWVGRGKRLRPIGFSVIGGALLASLVSCASDQAEASGEATAAESRSATTTTTQLDPLSSSVFLGGDSLTFTAIWDQGTGDGAPADLTWSAWIGWTAADVQPKLEQAVALGQADTVVLALGVNDSSPTGDHGWTMADVQRFQQLLDAPQPAACVVIVLPGYGDSVSPEHAAQIDEARAGLEALANQRQQQAGYGPTVVVDWQAVLDAQPNLVANDGIHLASDPATGKVSAKAAAARTGLYWQGVSACADG